MREIPEEMIEEVERIVDELVVYKNKDNLSWTQAYRDVLNKLGLKNKSEDNKLLICVVKKITQLKYDINPYPFKLEKF